MIGPIDHPAPVVLLRSARHGGLGIARSLGRLGVPVYCVESGGWSPIFNSRYCRGRYTLDIDRETAEDAVARLLEIGRKLERRPILIPTTDTATIWTAENAEALREVFRFPRQDPELVRTLCDKGRMQELAHRHGVPVARSAVPHSREDVLQFLESAVFPVMVKATDAERLRRAAGGTKFIVHSHDELLTLYDRAENGGEPDFLIQEYIPGEDWMLDGYFDQSSEYLFGVTGKKIRRFPAKTGVTSLGVCLRNDTVERTTVEFMQAIGYRGILDIGYRRDSRDGQYKILDVNPRIGCTFRLFEGTGGMDVARALYLSLTGRTVLPSEAVEGRKWLVEDFDLFSAVRSMLDGELSLKEWANSLCGVNETACFAADDPLPFLSMWISDASEFFRWMRRQTHVHKRGRATEKIGPNRGEVSTPLRRMSPGNPMPRS
jgi:predicted ATP-grasp superfamily ATP-dependent carboligase